jgi:hypothetical protein
MSRRAGAPARPVTVRLPPLTSAEAHQLVDGLERLLAALGRAYGDDLADRRARLGLETPRPRGARWAGRRGSRGGAPDF